MKGRSVEGGKEATPETLLVLESCLVDNIECFGMLRQVPIELLMEWEASSSILADGLARIKWWKANFKLSHPVTFERALSSKELLEGTWTFVEQGSNVWRGLCSMRFSDLAVWKETIEFSGVKWQARHAVVGFDEAGAYCIHQWLVGRSSIGSLRTCVRSIWWGRNGDSVSQSYFNLDDVGASVVRLWTLPFPDTCLGLLQNRIHGRHDLVWIRMLGAKESAKVDLRLWVLNYNTLLENEDDFVVPVSLDGSLGPDPVLVASAAECVAVILDGATVLIFDGLVRMRAIGEAKHWRHYLTCEFREPNHCWDHRDYLETKITAACYVLNSFLLLATNDGVLRARPRSNPRSEYYVERTKSLVAHMTSLYNVVALIHNYCTLDVRLVSRAKDDPFVSFRMLYQTTGVDCEHAPLLYGPYVIFAGLDGCWYRVMYDSGRQSPIAKELIKIPNRPGWKILSVKNANWRYWTVVAEEAVSKQVEELFIFSKHHTAAHD